MSRLGKLLISESFLFIFFSIIFLIAGTVATPYRSLIARPGTVYDGTEFYGEDFSVYVSYINEGQQGRWTVIDKHTTEPHNGTLIHEEYLLWGKLMGLFGFDGVETYHLGRIFFGSILFLSLYFFLSQVLPKKTRLFVFLVIIFSTGFPEISRSQEGSLIIRNQLEWFTEVDVFQRFTVLIHYLLGNIFFLLSLTLFIKILINPAASDAAYLNSCPERKPALSLPKGRRVDFLFLIFAFILSGISLAFTHPVSFIIFTVMISIYLLFSTTISLLISSFKFSVLSFKLKKEAIPAILIIAFASPILIYFQIQNTTPVWRDIALWDKVSQYYFLPETFVKILGINFFLAPLGLLALFNRKFIKENFDKLYIINFTFYIPLILLSWILSFFILFYYSYPFLGISQLRFMQNFVFIPFGILSAISLLFLSRVLSPLFARLGYLLAPRIPSLAGEVGGNLFVVFFLLVIIGINLPSYYRSMELKLTVFSPSDPLYFPDKPWVEAIKWLSLNSKPEEAVISAWHAGHAIPYLGGNTVYVGHVWSTVNREKKEQKLYKFLGNQMNEQEARDFLQETTAKYLFFGYQEKSYNLKPETLPFLTKIFDNSAVQIYGIVF